MNSSDLSETRLHPPRLGRALLLLMLLDGCSDRSGDSDTDGTATTGGPGSTSTGEPSPTTGLTTTSATATTVEPTSTSATDSSTGEPGTTGGEPGTTGGEGVCPPLESAFFAASITNLDPFFEGTLEWDCEVLALTDAADGLSIDLECTSDMAKVDPAPTLVLTAQPLPGPIAMSVGDAVHVQVEQVTPWWTETKIRVEAMDKTLLLAAVATTDPLGAIAGVSIKPAASICGTEETECGVVQHDAVDVTIDGASAEVQSRHFATVGAYGVWATQVRHYLRVTCTDFPDPWHDLSILRLAP